jgi:hypothetical protein
MINNNDKPCELDINETKALDCYLVELRKNNMDSTLIQGSYCNVRRQHENLRSLRVQTAFVTENIQRDNWRVSDTVT